MAPLVSGPVSGHVRSLRSGTKVVLSVVYYLDMKLEKRAYQRRTVTKVVSLQSQGMFSVLVVSPPGSGKTEMAMNIVDDRTAIWVTHTRELCIQAYDRLCARFGSSAVSAVMAGRGETPGARVHVGTVQSFLKCGKVFPNVGVAILDEAHHYVADEWSAVRELYTGLRGGIQKVREVGLTATPERADGRPLGDIFQELVVAASYSELLKSGHIVPVRVFAPETDLGSDYARHPVDAWADYSEDSLTFAFFPRVHIARMYANEWVSRDVTADVIVGESPVGERGASMHDFKSGKCRILSTVNTMTEGVNVEEARAALLAKSFDFIGGYLQATGRVLRPSVGKKDSIIIDLTGASIRHGSPTQDREYSLTGRAISGPSHGLGGGGVVTDPEVRGVAMRLAHAGIPGIGIPKPIILPEADPVRIRNREKDKARVRTVLTRHGKAAARKMEEQLANLRGTAVRGSR